MTLRNLQIFIAVADNNSMTAAANQLHVSQPTISQAIAEMESYYGVKLFDRLAKHLYITEDGKTLLKYARHISNLFEEMEKTIKNPEKSGSLKVGASLTVGAYLLPQLVNNFKKTHPNLQLQIIIKNTKEIEKFIETNTIDFGLVEGSLNNPDLVVEPFMDDELVLVCGKKHVLHGTKKISLPELEKFNFVIREQGSGTRELFENVMASAGINWKFIWESNDLESLKNAAKNGIGIAVVPQKAIVKELKTAELFIIKTSEIKLSRKFSIIFHKNKYLAESMKSFFELCRAYKNN